MPKLFVVNNGPEVAVPVGDETVTLVCGRTEVAKVFPAEPPKVEEPEREDVPEGVTPYQYDSAVKLVRATPALSLSLDATDEERAKAKKEAEEKAAAEKKAKEAEAKAAKEAKEAEEKAAKEKPPEKPAEKPAAPPARR